jgi:hypothetical protein
MLVIFEIGSHFMPVLTWMAVLLFVLPHLAGLTAAHHRTSHWLRWGFTNVLSRTGLKPQPSQSVSQVPRITDLSHRICFISFFNVNFLF